MVRARLVSAGPLARRLAPRRRFETNAGGSWAVVAKTTVTAALTADFPDEGSPTSTRRWRFLIGSRLNSVGHTGATAAGNTGLPQHRRSWRVSIPRCRGRPAHARAMPPLRSDIRGRQRGITAVPERTRADASRKAF